MIDLGQPAVTAGLFGVLTLILRIIERRMKRITPGTVEHMAENFKKLHARLDTSLGEVNEKIDGLASSNRHRRAEIKDLTWKIERLTQRMDTGSDA